MDFVENIGRSYLERKANQVPYQLENTAKKQFFGGDKTEQNPAAGEARGLSHSEGAAVPKNASGSGSSGKDAELARLRKELAAYRLSQGNSKSPSEKAGKGYVEGNNSKPTSKAGKLEALDGRLEKGKMSTKPKKSIQTEKKGPKAANPLVGLVALDGRVEKGQISTRKPSKALAEAKEPRGQRRSSSALAMPKEHSEGKESSFSAGYEAGVSHRASSAASEASSHRPSRDKAPRKAASRGRNSGYDNPSSEEKSSDEESEHGGSVALLHARANYRRRSSLGAVPEIPPLESRPEVVGRGFRPHRSPPGDREVDIIEVIEDSGRGAPRRKQRPREARRRDGDGVVEVGRERGGRTLYQVR